MYRYEILLLPLFAFLIASGCSSGEINESIEESTVKTISSLNEAAGREKLKNNTPACKTLFNDKALSLNGVEKCLYSSSEISIPYLIDQLIKHRPPVSQQILDKALIVLTHGSVYTKHTDSIRKLIVSGASTENVNLPYVWDAGDFACDAVMLVLKNNLYLYKDKNALNTKPKGNKNISNADSYPRFQDLFWLANTTDGRGICPKAIKLLARSNPKLLNTQDFTPLHSYLGDLNHPQWDIKVAKLLITKRNVNMHSKNGITPLHILLANRKSKWDLKVLNELLRFGADISIKGEVGDIIQGTSRRKLVSAKELILKRPDLIKVLP